MSNQLENKQRTLAQMLAANRLTKIAADQDIKHTTPYAQTGLGKEQTSEIEDNIEGTLAFTDAAANEDHDGVQEYPNCQSLNTAAEAALASTGTSIGVTSTTGGQATMPKSAAFYRNRLASILGSMNKQASQEVTHITTGSEALSKLAAYNESGNERDAMEAHDAINKLAASNELFNVAREALFMSKLAADVNALAEAEGISPDAAADIMDQAAEADPSIVQATEEEATGEAVSALAAAEQGAEELIAGADALAEGASSVLGAPVTGDDILLAVAEVSEQAEAMGVPPEALIEAAMEQMLGAEMEAPTEDEVQMAEAILAEAAANGVSPDEVLQAASEELAASGEGVQKQASYVAQTPRAAYVQSLLHQ